MLRLVEEILAGGLEGQAPGCQDEKKDLGPGSGTIVKQTADHQKAGWSTGFNIVHLNIFSSSS